MSKRKLLLADDSITIQKVVNLTFADEGIEVLTVGDGDSAMEKLAEFSPDLVMADVNMPGLTGYQICEKIKQDTALNHTPVILLVGSFEPFDEEEAKRVGADDFLTKPFQSIRQLVTKVTDLLNSDVRKTMPSEPSEPSESEPAADSFAETLEMPKPAKSAPDAQVFGDDEFDDEMIQTSQVSSFALDEAQKFETKQVIDYETEDYGKTQPLSADEVRDFAFTEPVKVKEAAATGGEDSVSEEAQELADESKEAQELADNVGDDISASEEVQEVGDNVEQDISASEETGDDLEDSEAASAKTLTYISGTDFEESNTDSEEAKTDLEESEASSAETLTYISGTDTHLEEVKNNLDEARTEELPFPATASILDLDDDILELPPVEGEDDDSAEEAGENVAQTPEESASHAFVSEPGESNEPGEPTADTPEPVAEESPTSNISANSLEVSPELIDLIVQKVIEKLSDKAVRDVAWEVVPQIAELIVTKMTEEKLKG